MALHAHPNVCLILWDDASHGDLFQSPHPAKTFTNNINAIGETGGKVINDYLTQTVCSPSRLSMLTGRNSSALGMYFTTGETGEELNFLNALPADLLTIQQHFRAQGYKVGHFGKWHIGGEASMTTLADFGLDAAGGWSWPSTLAGVSSGRLGADFIAAAGGGAAAEMQARDELVFDNAIDFVEAWGETDPILLILALTAPHTPLNPSSTAMTVANNFRGGPDGTGASGAQRYHASFAQINPRVDDLRDAFAALGTAQEHWDNTFMIFTADNGGGSPRVAGNSYDQWASPRTRRGYKGTVGRGGLNPFFAIKGPGVGEGTRVSGATICVEDMAASLCTLAGIAAWPEPTDGEDRSLVFLGSTAERTKPIFRFSGQGSVATLETCHRFPSIGGFFPHAGPDDERINIYFNVDEDRIIVPSSLQIYDWGRGDTSEMTNLAGPVALAHGLNAASKYQAEIMQLWTWYRTLPEVPWDDTYGSLSPDDVFT